MTTPSPVKPALTTADLPAAVLSAINACVGACRATLIQLEGDRDRLRDALARRIHPAPNGPVRRLCAVDGAHAMAPAAGATFAAIAAVAVEDATLMSASKPRGVCATRTTRCATMPKKPAV